MVSALNSCLTQKGLHAWVEQGPTPEQFTFRTILVPSRQSEAPATVEALHIENAVCQGVVAEGAKVGADGGELLCERTNKEAVSILFDADVYVQKDTPLALDPIFVPPPLPERKPIYIRAVDYTRGIDVAPANGEVAHYGRGEVLLNAPKYIARPNMAEYEFEAEASGLYTLSIEYAAAQSRPVSISINDKEFRAAALAETTGCWDMSCQRLVRVGEVRLLAGENKIRISRENVFPHLRTIRFDPKE